MKKYLTNHRQLIITIGYLLIIGILLMFFQKRIILVNGSDDMIFFEKAQNMSYFSFIIERYMTWSSRIEAESLIYFFVTMPLKFWKVANVLMIFLLAYSVNRIFKKKVSMIDFLFVLLTFGLIGQRILTSSTFVFHGSFNYLWPAATGIFALIPLADYFFRSERVSKKYLVFLYGFASVVTVLANEQISLAMLGFYVCFIVYAKFSKKVIPKELYILSATVALSLLVVILAPGNSIRYHAEIGRWYPDFNQISFGTFMERNIAWFFDKLFSLQKLLVMLLGYVAYLYYFQKIQKRNIFFELLLVFPIAISLVSGFGDYEYILFKFNEEFAKNSGFIFAYWIVYLAMLMYLLVRIDEKKYVNILIFAAGISTMLMMWASPSIFASKNRAMFICSVFLVILINKIRLDSKFKIDKNLWIYGIFPIINLLLIFDSWKKVFTVRY